jgi:hypothetical protein
MAPHDDDEASVPLIAAPSHTSFPDEHAKRVSADRDAITDAPGSAKRHSRFREEMDDTHENVYAEREGLRRADSEEEEEMQDQETLGDVDESKLLRPGVFIWCLTLCAGVSGLLFGYEYVCFLFRIECACWGKGDRKPRRCSTLWYEPTIR